MLNLSPATRVFVATAPVDLRGSFNALYGRVQTQLQADPLSDLGERASVSEPASG